MKPENDFYYGLGVVTAAVIILITWALCVAILGTDINPGTFGGAIVMGLYYMYIGIMKGRKNG